MELPILTLLIAIPLVAGAVCLFLSANGARWLALVATLLDLIGASTWVLWWAQK